MLYIDPNIEVDPDTAQRYMSLHILPYTNGNKDALRKEMTYFINQYPTLSYQLLVTFAVTKEDLTDTLTGLSGTDRRIKNEKFKRIKMKQALELLIH